MRVKVAVLMMVLLALAACQRGERATVTGAYGTSVLSGVVVMGDGGTPAGVNVTVKGTGMAAVLAADGRFVFAGAPEQAELVFDRAADGISATLRVETNAGPVVVELAKGGAKKSGRRRSTGTRPSASELEGLVRSATATEVVVFTSKKVEQTIAITPETIVRRGQTILTPADLLVDTRVHVKALKTDSGAFNAFLIIVQAGEEDQSPERKEFEGIVISSAAEQLVMTDSHGSEQTFILDAGTEIRKGKRAVPATEIQPGWRVHVKATTNADGTRTAREVIVQNTGGGDGDDGEDEDAKVKFGGRVTAVGTTTLTVETGEGVVTVQTDASTAIEKGGSAVALSAILAGDKVKVEGTRVDTTTVLAKRIEVR